MISTSMSVIVVLVALVNGARNDDIQPCAKIQTSSSVVHLGSPVTASCVIREDCPLVIGRAVHILWRLGDRFLPSSPVANESGRVSEVVIPSFNHTREFLTCCVRTSTYQVLEGVEIRAGYPPEAPQNLSCQTNLTTPNTLTCSWDPGQQETLLDTEYTLHTEIRDSNENHTYELLPGVHRYTIPRYGFVLFSDVKIYVKAVNELGEATSAPIILEPVSSAKFDPPTILKIQAVPKRYGCLKLSWSLSQQQVWMRNLQLNLEVRLTTADSSQRREQPILVNRVRPTRSVDRCRLLHGTQYLAQIRVRYQQSPWSEWSSSQSGVTLESAPTGRLDSWMRVSGDHMNKQHNILLFWKPSKQFRANGQNVSYIVSVKKQPGEDGKVCSTMGNYCTFQLPGGAKKVYLSAVNAAGKSSPTEVRIYLPKARAVISDVTVIPQDDRSLLVQWRSLLSSSLTGFVVEWSPLLQTDLFFTQFELTARNQTLLVITDSFEPYKPYGISVYPRFKDGIGLPQTVNAYSRQKAPSMVPKIQIKKIGKSHVEFTWDEIPLNQRNGIIQNYKVFYCDTKGPISVVNADLEKRRVVLRDLNTVSLYEAFMMVSTFGGSLNGSTIHFEIDSFDTVAVVAIVPVSVIGLFFMVIFIAMTSFSNNKRLKGHFWPAVPDPANSSIKRWTSESTQGSHLSLDNEEPNPMYLSHLSFLDDPVKLSKEDDDPWLSAEDTSDLGESICGSPFIPGYSGSNSDSVPYVTVTFSGPCSSPTPKDPHVYLRSESTQPLLETEESFSPKCYHNIASVGMQSEQRFFGPSHDSVPERVADPGILCDDFPFLRALSLRHTEID
ncbi:granulocyte colony-stimulating factor receptor isoform X2 [Cyclopterus lumpus]|uniref:granulocyte colony-stimulating factor receptor isoform X2 n=1 Tax=Cyclopterus lumpus TaxID=8103 RepID=UPI001486423E|nr:granulocyte colony-stimulating factor receptor isoform X2 [Cyclopterus lumpus]XP_034409018.1 granulocyte colony-stimulating factor receptor isoform X2 [Cyclopterus lumpus]XP_034409019.1 granulocyte colony-stimulating factor receptor isoform X2 [Cyclopterus lumpus]